MSEKKETTEKETTEKQTRKGAGVKELEDKVQFLEDVIRVIALQTGCSNVIRRLGITPMTPQDATAFEKTIKKNAA